MIDDCGPPVDGEWALPGFAHVPGVTAAPAGASVAAIVGEVDDTTNPENWRTNRVYLYGFVLYRGGFFWEAHEVWETVWHGCRPNAPERCLVQALIQLANAALKGRMGRDSAVRRLLRDADRLVNEVIVRSAAGTSGNVLMGVDLIRLRQQISDRY